MDPLDDIPAQVSVKGNDANDEVQSNGVGFNSNAMTNMTCASGAS